MYVGLLDMIFIIILLFGTLLGFKRGMISSLFSCIGLIIIICLSFLLKNVLSEFMYLHFPFFNFTSGLTLLNILVYEGISFLIIFSILLIIYKLLLFLTKIIDKIIKATIILAIPSKIIGAIFGFIESYLIVFIVCFLCVMFHIKEVETSSFVEPILTKTPIISEYTKKNINVVMELKTLKDEFEFMKNDEEYEKKVLETFLKYEVITPESTRKLAQKEKIKIKNIEEIIQKYE